MIQNYFDIFIGLMQSEKVVLFVFAFLFLLRFVYLFLFPGRILFRKKTKTEDETQSQLSLILTIRNEEKNLKLNLPGVLSLKNNNFEMVVVDDFSQDNSYLILGLLKGRYRKLSISTLNQETRFSTKLAQNIAIKATKNQWILSFPVSISNVNEKWLDGFSKESTKNKNVVVAYSNIAASKGFYNYLYRIENYFLYTKSTAYILNGFPFVYSDENVAFRKEKYFDIGGYGQKITEPFANLELLINQFITKKTTSILLNIESSIRKTEPIRRQDYFEILKKSIRIEKHLPVSIRLVLVIDQWSKLLLLPFALLVFIFIPKLWVMIVGLLSIKFIANLFIIKTSQKHLKEPKIFIPSLVYDLLMPYYKLFFRLHFNRRSTKNKWKSKV